MYLNIKINFICQDRLGLFRLERSDEDSVLEKTIHPMSQYCLLTVFMIDFGIGTLSNASTVLEV